LATSLGDVLVLESEWKLMVFLLVPLIDLIFFHTIEESVWLLILDTYCFHDEDFLLLTRCLVIALVFFKLIKSVSDKEVWNFLRALFLFWMTFFISSFHHGTRGLGELLLDIPIVIKAVSVIMSVNSLTSKFMFSGEGVWRFSIFFSIKDKNRFQLAFLIDHRDG